MVDHLHYLVSLVLLALRKGQKHEGFSLRLYEKVASSDAMKKSEDFMGTCQEAIVDHCCTVSISRITPSSLSVPSTVTETQHELDCSLQ